MTDYTLVLTEKEVASIMRLLENQSISAVGELYFSVKNQLTKAGYVPPAPPAFPMPPQLTQPRPAPTTPPIPVKGKA